MADGDEGTLLQGKTPISYLQELCTKRGITPQYDLVANEGAVHEPLFVFKVTAGEYVGTGKGPSKKKAKHNAAVSVLTQMSGIANGSTGDRKVTSEIPSARLNPVDTLAGNPVGELQEMTQKRMWPPPVYDFTSEQGPPHAREFVCTVRLFNVAEQAVGKSKKLAKRNSAQAMIQRILQGGVVAQVLVDHSDDFEEEPIPLPQNGTNVPFGSSKPTDTRQQTGEVIERKKISAMFQPGKNKIRKVLDSLQNFAIDDEASDDFGEKLNDLAKEQKFEVNFVDMEKLSISGKYQCMIQLSTTPVTVSYGSGRTVDEAHTLASRNALKYLKVMTRRL